MESESSAAATLVPPWPGLIQRPARGTGNWPAGVWAVLVHGAMDRGAGMAHLARQLRDVATLRYDRRGYGHARSLGTGDLACHIEDLVGLVGERPVVLFGHSYGGLVVLGAAATMRLDVRGLATWEAPTPWIGNWPGWDLDHGGDRPEAVAEQFMRSVIGDERWEQLPARTREARRAEGPALLSDMDPELALGVPFDMERIQACCVLGVGDVSTAPYRAAADQLIAHLAHAQIRVLPGASHGAPMSQAAAIAGLIRVAAGAVDGRGDDGQQERHGAAV